MKKLEFVRLLWSNYSIVEIPKVMGRMQKALHAKFQEFRRSIKIFILFTQLTRHAATERWQCGVTAVHDISCYKYIRLNFDQSPGLDSRSWSLILKNVW